MNEQKHSFEEIWPGDTVSIENTQDSELSISITTADGARFNMGLGPGQVVEFAAGDSDARIMLHGGDPSGLLIVRPELPS